MLEGLLGVCPPQLHQAWHKCVRMAPPCISEQALSLDPELDKSAGSENPLSLPPSALRDVDFTTSLTRMVSLAYGDFTALSWSLKKSLEWHASEKVLLKHFCTQETLKWSDRTFKTQSFFKGKKIGWAWLTCKAEAGRSKKITIERKKQLSLWSFTHNYAPKVDTSKNHIQLREMLHNKRSFCHFLKLELSGRKCKCAQESSKQSFSEPWQCFKELILHSGFPGSTMTRTHNLSRSRSSNS